MIKRKMMINVLLIVLLFFPSLAMAQPSSPKIKAVATFSILGDVVRQIGGDNIELTVLVGADGDVHSFEPAPADSVSLAEADIVFENGLFFEPWLEHLYQSSASKAKRVLTTEGIELINEDPHIWHDVNNMMVVSEWVRDGLIAVDPAHEADYRQRAEVFMDALGELNMKVIDTLKDIPDERRVLLTSHDSLGYFAHRYGFKVIAAIIPSSSTEVEDPSAAHLSAVMDAIKAHQVKTIFIENMVNPKLADALARDAGAAVAPPLYTDALGPKGSGAETYMDLIKHNASVIAEALK